MIKRVYRILLVLFLLPATVFAGTQYDRIYVFGDSLSDTGNLASIVGAFPEPPYYQNRVTNGLVAVEVLAARLNLPLSSSLHLIGPAQGNNYAVVAARSTSNEPQDLATQIALFLANHGGVAPENALYVMFIGGNDIRSGRDNPDPVAGYQTVSDAAQIVANQIRVLAMAGAQNWLLVNAPDIGAIPETRLIAEAIGNPGFPTHATALTNAYNDSLKRHAEQLEDELNLEIEVFNTQKKFAKVVSKALKLGFTNITDACFSSDLGQYTLPCNFGFNIDQFIFFDEIHPTARVHALIGEMMYRKVADDDGDEKEHKDDEDEETESAEED